MKTDVAIIGSGNIGTDLLHKLRRSTSLNPVAVIGVDPSSTGLAQARELGLWTTHDGVEDFLKHQENEDVEILFDATSAWAHRQHAPVLIQAGKTLIDLTPAALGPYVIPPVNLGDHVDAKNVNLVSCGGQATIPIVAAINRVGDARYAEIVATISSKSAGAGTRQNIDEFTRTTAKGIESLGGADRGKAIIILNPADPPIMMRNTIHVTVANGDQAAIARSVQEMVDTVSAYVPGYRLVRDPIFDGDQVTVFLEVEGAGDFLPPFAGNLDIMTAAAVKVGEELVARRAAVKTR